MTTQQLNLAVAQAQLVRFILATRKDSLATI
jgi:hypothetical protein